MTRKIFIFILFSTILSNLFAQSAGNNVSVLAFEGKDISSTQAESISDLFAVELVNGSGYTVLDRANMNKILKEQQFQQSGCTDNACAVEIGKLLNMDYMFTGTVMKLGDNLFITVSQVSVGTGAIVKSARTEGFSIGSISDIINDLVGNFSKEVDSKKGRKKRSKSVKSENEKPEIDAANTADEPKRERVERRKKNREEEVKSKEPRKRRFHNKLLSLNSKSRSRLKKIFFIEGAVLTGAGAFLLISSPVIRDTKYTEYMDLGLYKEPSDFNSAYYDYTKAYDRVIPLSLIGTVSAGIGVTSLIFSLALHKKFKSTAVLPQLSKDYIAVSYIKKF